MATKSKAPAEPAAAVQPAAAPAAAAAVNPAAPLAEEAVDNLVLIKRAALKKDRNGRVVVKAEAIDWLDANNPDENFSVTPAGIEKIWLTSRARGTSVFPFQVNIQIYKGARYRFQDFNRETGSNDAVVKLFEAIKSRFPNILVGEPDIEK